MAPRNGNKLLSRAADAAETRVRTVVAPYLKALRSPSAILVDGSLALFLDADP